MPCGRAHRRKCARRRRSGTLSKKYPIDSLAEALAEGLSVGHPDMPEVTFQPYDVSAILAYLKSIQER